MPRDMTGTGRYPPVPRFKPFTWYTAVRNADPEMVSVHAFFPLSQARKGAELSMKASSDPPQLAKIMAADPYFVTQDNGAGAPLHFATTYRQLDMVHHLLNQGGEVNQRDPRGLTPLHRAAHLAHLDGYVEIYEYLLSRGADPSIRANELEPYLAPGRCPVPSDMACNAEVGNALKLIEARYKAVPKVRVPHADIGDWWALYDYGLEAIKTWPLDYKPQYPEEVKRQLEQKAIKAAHCKAFLDELKANGPDAARKLAASMQADASRTNKQGPAPMPGPDPSKPLVAFVFPGQGSQLFQCHGSEDVGMLDQTKDLPAVKSMLETAKSVLGYDLLERCTTEGPSMRLLLACPKEALDDTEVAQPALFVAGLAAAERLRHEDPGAFAACGAAAGLSLGEYCALVFAGALSFEDGLKVVKQRATSMAAAARSAADALHGMLSVVGLHDNDLEDICRQAIAAVAPAPGGTVCQLANMLFPQGRVISGHVAALEHAAELAKGKGALKAQLLAVSGAFHTRLMEPARSALSKVLAEVPVHAPRVPVLSNVTAKPFPSSDQAIRELLARQLVEPVQGGTHHSVSTAQERKRLNSSRPDAVLITPFNVKHTSNGVSPIHSHHALRSSSLRTTRTSRMRQPHELYANERHVHLIEIKFCEDTRPEHQLNAAKQQHAVLKFVQACKHRHADLCKFINAKAVTIHPILLVWQGLLTEVIKNPASLLPGTGSASEPVCLYELGPGQQIKAMVRRIDGAAWKAMKNVSS
ncbi:hypothetical protein DUNSADRAFT_5905 [Dunaliella salina]|uniref:Malonyl-CoA:ACP transacylase (MAT) domain-containing protein n=1 Tax=Dunaliella salina TaxID=3046 RepID=A0ABQ7GPD4_DUNSA|nr:hypothetical protein DUNSADRAFT_5905 [Dunaliella salina]|eukprot:KAF5836458.1 hypothetical protein DUNSADRAFT_5905 [Dunaliella salina]